MAKRDSSRRRSKKALKKKTIPPIGMIIVGVGIILVGVAAIFHPFQCRLNMMPQSLP